jgi:hypothetical protein
LATVNALAMLVELEPVVDVVCDGDDDDGDDDDEDDDALNERFDGTRLH